jgi:hypothetical protein
MGTISDKLMRIINTKEDIRRALISKGYDVPTSMPFKEYAKMILDLPCNADSFPDIEGIVARYSALGLTNEQMATNPVWVDKTGNGHDLQMKNFAWSGMSGVGGYEMNFNLWTNNVPSISDISMSKTTTSVSVSVGNSAAYNNNLIYIHMNNWDINKNHWLKVTSTYEDGDLVFKFYNDNNSKNIELPANGYVNIPAYPEFKGNYMYISTTSNKQGSFTIEQLPLYPGALVFDGVDDYGTCDNFPILTKEKGYTVVALRQYLFNATDKIRSLVTNAPSSIVSRSTLTFELIDLKGEKINFLFGKGNLVSDFEPNVFSYMTSKSYNGKTITPGDVTESNERILVGNFSENGKYGSNVAIWELVFLDHDATEEELTKIKDYFVKTYPWLFPDQAWTVVGKTNEDEDRATIANITGNGNNLVLSNFGFAEGSGYGLYYQYFGNEFKATNGEIEGGGWNIIDNYNISHDKRIPINSIGKCFWGNKALVNGIKLRFKLTGMTEGDVLAFGYAATYDLTYTSDGIYAIDLPPVDKPYGFSLQSSLTENLPTTPVTIELLPFEYEGYLVTDGVDDKAVSKQFKFGENFTVILDFKFPVKKISYCGFDLSSKVRIQNLQGSGVYVVLKGNKTLIPSNIVRAVTSEGKVYDENWNEYNIVPGNISSNYTMVNLGFDGSNQFAESATKLAGIYSSALSKDDCIKAYNYLQTLKSK